MDGERGLEYYKNETRQAGMGALRRGSPAWTLRAPGRLVYFTKTV